jgi:hypothetical protein
LGALPGMRAAVFRVGGKRYETVQQHGQGTCAQVWVARAEDNTECVLKVYGVDRVVGPDQVVKEAGMSRTLERPYFVKTLAAGSSEDRGVPVVVMELAERWS